MDVPDFDDVHGADAAFMRVRVGAAVRHEPPSDAPAVAAMDYTIEFERSERKTMYPRPHLRRDWAHPRPHLRRDWVHPRPRLRRDCRYLSRTVIVEPDGRTSLQARHGARIPRGTVIRLGR